MRESHFYARCTLPRMLDRRKDDQTKLFTVVTHVIADGALRSDVGKAQFKQTRQRYETKLSEGDQLAICKAWWPRNVRKYSQWSERLQSEAELNSGSTKTNPADHLRNYKA